MSGIAKVVLEMGYQVTGSDLKESRYTRSLRDLGAKIAIGHHPKNLGEAPTVVISSAIPEYNLELRAALSQGLNVVPRAKMLAEICQFQSLRRENLWVPEGLGGPWVGVS